jgi:glycosyltransferase involved in cell wall biosynthesis
MAPLVSIIVTCFNQAPYLERSVKSVLSQTFTDFECLMIDDGSTDNTREIAEHLMSIDSRVKYFHKENGGVSSARNFGFRQAQGEWIHFLDGDDWIDENKTSFQLSHLEDGSDGKDTIFYSDYERVFMDKEQNIIKRQVNVIGFLTSEQLIERLLIPDFLADSPFPVLQQCMLMNRSIFQKKIFDERLKALQDRDFPLELLVSGVKFIYTPIVGAFYTKHQTNRTNNWPYMKNFYIMLYETVYEKHRDLMPLCEAGLDYLIKDTIREKDKTNFERLVRIAQPPFYLWDKKLKIDNKSLLNLLYLMRTLTPSFLLYEKYRGPRSKKLLSIFSNVFSSTKKAKTS